MSQLTTIALVGVECPRCHGTMVIPDPTEKETGRWFCAICTHEFKQCVI